MKNQNTKFFYKGFPISRKLFFYIEIIDLIVTAISILAVVAVIMIVLTNLINN